MTATELPVCVFAEEEKTFSPFCRISRIKLLDYQNFAGVISEFSLCMQFKMSLSWSERLTVLHPFVRVLR